MKTKLKIEGFHCKSCKMLVEDVCSDFSEITSVQINEKNGDISIEHGSDFDLSSFKKEIESLGDYRVKKR